MELLWRLSTKFSWRDMVSDILRVVAEEIKVREPSNVKKNRLLRITQMYDSLSLIFVAYNISYNYNLRQSVLIII